MLRCSSIKLLKNLKINQYVNEQERKLKFNVNYKINQINSSLIWYFENYLKLEISFNCHLNIGLSHTFSPFTQICLKYLGLIVRYQPFKMASMLIFLDRCSWHIHFVCLLFLFGYGCMNTKVCQMFFHGLFRINN